MQLLEGAITETELVLPPHFSMTVRVRDGERAVERLVIVRGSESEVRLEPAFE